MWLTLSHNIFWSHRFITYSCIHIHVHKRPNLGTILSRYTCAIHRQGHIPLPIVVHLSSHPNKEYRTFFTCIYFTGIVVDTSEYENNLLSDTMNIHCIVSMHNVWVCVYIGKNDHIMDINNSLRQPPSYTTFHFQIYTTQHNLAQETRQSSYNNIRHLNIMYSHIYIGVHA